MGKDNLKERVRRMLIEGMDMPEIARILKEEGYNALSAYVAAQRAGIKKVFLLPEEYEVVMKMRSKAREEASNGG